MWRSFGGGMLGAVFISGALLLSGVNLRQLPWGLGGMGFVMALAFQYTVHRDAHSKSVPVSAVSIVPDHGGALKVERQGQLPSMYLLSDGTPVPAGAMGSAPAGSDNDFKLNTTLTYGEVAKLWLTGEARRTIHGLQPQPANPPEYIAARFVTTELLIKSPPSPPPVLIFHRSTLDDPSDLLTLLALDGTQRWQSTFTPPISQRARQFFVVEDRLVFVLGSTTGSYDMSGNTVRRRGHEGPEAVVVSIASGTVTWRARL